MSWQMLQTIVNGTKQSKLIELIKTPSFCGICRSLGESVRGYSSRIRPGLNLVIETTCICCWSDAMMMLLCSAKVPFRDLSLQFIPHYSVMVFGYAAVEREVFSCPPITAPTLRVVVLG